MADPFSIFTNIGNLEQDMNLFADGAEIMENLVKCKFEGPAFDLMHMCTAHPDECAGPTLIDNLTKNMFVLVGKITSLAETLKGFPANDNGDFKEQMQELGDDAGTVVRTLLNLHKD